jgi:Lipase maturation factor
MFASGAVKLASGCPNWWELSALKHHFLTMPLPTNLAFYSYYLPEGYLKLTTISVYISELICPWFFFAPIRSLRIFTFYWLLFLQLCIIATGNYGYLSFIIIAMLFSLLDDSHFKSRAPNTIGYRKIFSIVLTLGVLFFIMITTLSYFDITWKNGSLDASTCKLFCFILNSNF